MYYHCRNNRNTYTKLLIEQLRASSHAMQAPFCQSPNYGPLPTLPASCLLSDRAQV